MYDKKNNLPKAVIFDVDGVLVDSEQFISTAACLMFEELGLKVVSEDFHPFVGTGESYCLNGLAKKYGIQIDVEKAKQRTYDIYLEIIKGNLQPIAGVYDFIETCLKMGKKLALASSSDHRKIMGNLKEIGLPTDHFQTIISGQDVTDAKPAPDIYLLAADRLQLAPAECLVVEDAISGVTAAAAAGTRCLALTTSFTPEQLKEALFCAPNLVNVPPEVLDWSSK